MSGTITYACSGCDEVASVPWACTTTSEPIGGGIDKVYRSLPSIDGAAPAGWIPVDPYTSTTYCPTCWSSIEGDERDHERTWVDDGEVWIERDGDGWRLGVAVNDKGDYISHHLDRADAATLGHLLAPESDR